MDAEYTGFNNDELVCTDKQTIIEKCPIHNEKYTKICIDDKLYCDKCDTPHNTYFYAIEDWKMQSIIKINQFRDELNNKIKGLNCIIEIIKDKNSDDIIKYFMDIIDTLLVDISHIDNFDKFINEFPISSIIKRKNYLLTKTINVSEDVINKLDRIIKFIVINLFDIHSQYDYALRWASHDGKLDIVKCLVKYGADIHACDDYAFDWAARNNHLDVVEYLIKDCMYTDGYSNWVLIKTSESGHLDIVKCLIAHGADVHAQNDKALFCASENGHLDVVEYLISHGADIHACNYRALQSAYNDNHQAVVELLIKHGAKLN
jgi:hypothetical protein